ncbi:MAG: DUF86 domain-containing protein [Ignavibacteriales bacterium UTCHB2]|jgi:uncharacterized protein with HEPN domain|nr:MAG: hypothetical protein BWY38_01275 [Ignavibacteria bacterium ADurb.Bin266]OQY73795.1 MAG: DUF86 domain-containing protein [Ignavibacteriales bacterium UTCHB2]HQI42293.1 DUF86 domain-containing protein [Ignavibacteriaceae bacterium]
MKSKLGDKARLQHISEAIKEIEKYIENISYEDFQINSMMQFATVKQLEIIGEASNQLTDHFKKLYKEIEWREIVGLRNILIHEYFGIDTKIVWDILQIDLPELKIRVEDILKQI